MTNNKPISKVIKEIESDIVDLNNQVGMKKKVTKYNEITKKIKLCKEQVTNITNSKLIDKQPVSKCNSDSEYDTLIKEINMAKDQIVDGMDVEQLVEIYKKAIVNINKCDEYIKTKKMELVEII